MAYITLCGIPIGYEYITDEGERELICFKCAVIMATKDVTIRAKTLDPDSYIYPCVECGGNID